MTTDTDLRAAVADPETTPNLCHHLRRMADDAKDQIDADRLMRATGLIAELRKVTAERDTAIGNLFIMRVERDNAEDHGTETANELRTVRARAEAAEAEVARLTDALREISDTKLLPSYGDPGRT